MRPTHITALCVMLLASACQKPSTPGNVSATGTTGATGGATDTGSGGAGAAAAALGVTPTAPEPACSEYRSDLTDGDMVRIYYATAGLTPPLEKWAEQAIPYGDQGVSQEEVWKRATAQVNAQWNAVKDVRCVTIRANADIGPYDDARGGLPIGALRPNTYYSFAEGADRVQVRFRNIDSAELWKLPRDKAMALTANYALGGAAVMLRAKVLSARPSDQGGVIEARVVGYDIVPNRAGIPQQTIVVEK